MLARILTGTIILLLSCNTLYSQNRKAVLRSTITRIIDTNRANVGVGIMGLDFSDSLIINGTTHFPMQSVYKFPLAMAILHKVDKQQLSLTQHIHIPKERLDTNTWSPMVKKYGYTNIDISLSELLLYSISKSDNNACDELFKLIGGTAVVHSYIRSHGISGIAISTTEREMKQAWAVQYTNWCTPPAMLQMLRIFYKGKSLSKSSSEFLMRAMVESENSPNRIKGLLPADAVVAHKTGTSNTNETGLTAATNDVGIVTLPNRRHYAIVVYVSDYKGGVKKGEQIIASISSAVWQYFTSK